MASPTPTAFQFIGPEEDPLGAQQIAFSRPLGGGATADGQDEVGLLNDNAHYLWDTASLAVLNQITTYGDAGTPQTAWESTTSASFQEVAQILCETSPDRNEIEVDVDYADGQVRLGVYDAATDTLIGAAQTTTSTAGRTQEQKTFSGLSANSVYVKVEIVKNTTECFIYSVRVQETPALSATNATYGFKKLDESAVGADEPFDGLVTTSLVGNTDAAYQARGRRWGRSWPLDDGALVTACEQRPIAYPMGLYRVSRGATKLAVKIRYEVQDAPVYAGLAVVDPRRNGRPVWSDGFPFTDTLTVTGAKATATITSADVSDYQGREVLVFLVVAGTESGTTSSMNISSGTSVVGGFNRVVNLTGITWPSGCLIIDMDQGAGGANADGAFPEPRLILRRSGNDVWVWPRFAYDEFTGTPDWATPAYTVTVSQIGCLTLYSYTCYEDADEFDEAITPIEALRPGRPISANAIRGIYRWQRELFLERTRIGKHAYDPGDTSNSVTRIQWGSYTRYDTTERDVAAVMVGDYGTALDKDGNTLTRTLRVTVAYQVLLSRGAIVAEGAYPVQWRGRLASWGGSAWDSNVVTSNTVSIPNVWALEVKRFDDHASNTADLSAPAFGAGESFGGHSFQGGVDALEIGRRKQDGISVASFSIQDTSPGNPRLLRIKATCYDRPFGGSTDWGLINPHTADFCKIRIVDVCVEEDQDEFEG
jgi:hypothetical protein